MGVRRGFSLLELAVVIVVVSLIAGFGLQALQNNSSRNCYPVTRQQMGDIQRAIDAYVSNSTNRRYPLPAKRNLKPTDPMFGKEVASPTTTDIDSPGNVLIGALPFATLGLPLSYASDCWSNKYTYIVTKDLTSISTYASGTGAITVRTGSLTASPGPAPQDLTTTAAYAIISHGEQALGATSLNYAGATKRNCNPAFADSAVTRVDKENCDVTNGTIFSSEFNNGANSVNYFDDIVLYAGKPSTSGCSSASFSWPNGCSAVVGALSDGGNASVTNTAANVSGGATVTCNNGSLTLVSGSNTCSCTNGNDNPPTCTVCSSGNDRDLDMPCPSGYTGTAKQHQYRASCSVAWADQGGLNTSGCTATTCANGATNAPTCTFAYTCTDTYCVSGACDAPYTYQSDTNESGTVGSPSTAAGGSYISCCPASGGGCAVNGICSDTKNSCNSGTPSGYTALACGETETWSCLGAGGGSTATCTYQNDPCVNCSTTGINVSSISAWHGYVTTPTYTGLCSQVTTAGQSFFVTTDTAGSSWHAETHNWHFTKGTASSQSYTPYDKKSKSTKVEVYYNGGCDVYAKAIFTRNKGSDYQTVKVAITGVNSCVVEATTSTGGGGGGGCFLGDAMVSLPDGSSKPISWLKVGDEVQGSTGINRVIAPNIHYSDETLYSFNGGEAFVTGEHMLMTTKGWRSIDPELSIKESDGRHHPEKLKVGDVLVMENRRKMVISSIDAHKDRKRVQLFNPALDGDHTYYVNGILVHNVKPISSS